VRNRDKDAPKRAMLLRDNDDPNVKKSKIDIEDPSLKA
jgi:hypothetical protein